MDQVGLAIREAPGEAAPLGQRVSLYKHSRRCRVRTVT